MSLSPNKCRQNLEYASQGTFSETKIQNFPLIRKNFSTDNQVNFFTGN